jgi:hypothetical protein
MSETVITPEQLSDDLREMQRRCNSYPALVAALQGYRMACRTRLACGCSELRCALCRAADDALQQAGITEG